MCALAECSALGLTRLQLKHQPGSILIWRLDWRRLCLRTYSGFWWNSFPCSCRIQHFHSLLAVDPKLLMDSCHVVSLAGRLSSSNQQGESLDSCSVTKSCLTLCDPQSAAHQGPLSSTISQSLLKLMSTQQVILSKHLILWYHCLLLCSLIPSIRVFSNESGFVSGSKVLLQLQHQSFQ